MSAGEDRAWQALRLLREEGIHVVRQHEIGRYTVDLAIRKVRIAIEIDGGVHDLPGRAEYDAQRQTHIERKGWRFVRFTSADTTDATLVINKVRAALPLPLRGGGGGWGEAPAPEGLGKKNVRKPSNGGASPHPLPPSPQGEGEFPKRRTRAKRKLMPRRKP